MVALAIIFVVLCLVGLAFQVDILDPPITYDSPDLSEFRARHTGGQ